MPYKDLEIGKKQKRQYYLANRDKFIVSATLRYENNKEVIKTKSKEYYLKNRTPTGESKGHRKGKEFKKEHIPWNKGNKGLFSSWNKGIPCTNKAKDKMSLARIGVEPANKGKKNPKPKEEHYNWKGGINPINDTIRKSLDYKLWREACFIRDNYTCQKSGTKGCSLVVHHILLFSKYPELRFSVDNGITLSKEVHREYHKKYGMKNISKEEFVIFLGSNTADELMFTPDQSYITHT